MEDCWKILKELSSKSRNKKFVFLGGGEKSNEVLRKAVEASANKK